MVIYSLGINIQCFARLEEPPFLADDARRLRHKSSSPARRQSSEQSSWMDSLLSERGSGKYLSSSGARSSSLVFFEGDAGGLATGDVGGLATEDAGGLATGLEGDAGGLEGDAGGLATGLEGDAGSEEAFLVSGAGLEDAFLVSDLDAGLEAGCLASCFEGDAGAFLVLLFFGAWVLNMRTLGLSEVTSFLIHVRSGEAFLGTIDGSGTIPGSGGCVERCEGVSNSLMKRVFSHSPQQARPKKQPELKARLKALPRKQPEPKAPPKKQPEQTAPPKKQQTPPPKKRPEPTPPPYFIIMFLS